MGSFKTEWKRWLSFALALVMLAGNLPVNARAAEVLALRYDDHLDMSGKAVEIVDAGQPTSYQVGYGVEENSLPDTAVVALEGDTLIATGIGTAKVTVDGTLCDVTVTAAPISLLLLIGQSNMQGSEGNADQSIVCPDGMVYSTYGDRYTMTVDNATNFAPSALTGDGSALNVSGTTANLEDWPVYLLNEAGAGKAGPDSGYAYEWVKQTGEKVWVVNAAHGGSSITTWQDGGVNYEEAVLLFSACQETLRKEIAAGHFTLSHMGYFWCQGCADETRTAQWYAEKFLSMHDSLKTELAADLDGDGDAETFEFANITVTLAGHVNKTGYRYEEGLYDAADSTFFMTYEELEMRGQRVAQYHLAANPDYPEINMVCNLGESWVTMPDGTDGVAEYFAAHYENGTVDYPTQVAQKSAWYKPTTPAAVKDSIHYNQIGYNEVGIEAARNTLILLGEIADSTEETTVRFVDWTGYREVSSVLASDTAGSSTLVVPIVYPCYRAKSVSYQLSEGLTYAYYDLLASSSQTTGTLTAIGASGSVDMQQGHIWSQWCVVSAPTADGPGTEERICEDCGETETRQINGVWQTLKLSDHMTAIPEVYCAATNFWTAMEHDKYFFNGTSSWNIHASGTVYSVTIPVNPGDRVYATSFGAAPGNGGTKDGIRCTFFSAEGVAKTTDPAGTYAEFSANGGYLVAPEGAVAVNVPMWNNSDDNELYILNAAHDYVPAVTLPTCTEQGYTTHICICGDSYVSSYVEATGEHRYENGICIHCATEEQVGSMTLRYDDYLDLSGKAVEIVDAGQPVSDGAAVIALEGDVLHAMGVGTARAKIDGTVCEITVEKAKLHILVIMGQSNAGNHFPNATSDITCPQGTAYWWGNGQGTAAAEPVDYTQPSMGFHTPLLAELYAQSVAAGDPVKNVMIWHEGITSKNGKSITAWASGAANADGTRATATMIENCLAYYSRHSDKFEIVHKGVYWLQGESDVAMDPEKYTQHFTAMWNVLKAAGMDYLAFLRVRKGVTGNTADRADLDYTGSLTAQIHMIRNNPEFHMATTLTENWLGTAATVHSVDIRSYITLMEEYGHRNSYSDSYGNTATVEDGILTTTMKALYGSNNTCHYGKFGYALIGADAAYNMHAALNGLRAPAVVQTDSSGRKSAEHISAMGTTQVLNIEELAYDLSFYPACGSPAGTMDIRVVSEGRDITAAVVGRETGSYECIGTEALRRYPRPDIQVSYTHGNTTEQVMYAVEFNHPCNIGHSYQGTACTRCGATNPNVSDCPENPLSTAWPTLNTDLTHILCYGQSFSNGSDAPIYPDPAVDGVYVLGSITKSSGDSLTAIPATGTQHPIISAVNSLSQMLTAAGIDTDIIAGSYGTGGRTIAQLMSAERQAQIKEEEGYTYDINSSGKYAVFQSSVSAIAAYAEAKGQTVSCPAIVYLQGETDQNTDAQLGYPDNPVRAGYGAGGDKEKYKLYMTRLKEDMQREVMEAYGQTEKPLFLIYQVSGTYTRTQYSSINMAQIEFAQENEDVILVQTPYFAPHYTSSHHLTVNGYRWLGEYIGNSLYTALVQRQKKWPMLPGAMECLSENQIRIRVNGAENGLSIDTYTVENATGSQNLYGFYLTVDGTHITPKAVEVSGNEILLTLPDGKTIANDSAVYVYYAGKSAKGTGNIRDNCTKVGFYDYLDDSADTGTGNNQGVSHSALDVHSHSLIGKKYPMYNWLASFCYRLDTVSLHTHSYDVTVVASTCTERGYTAYACACGDAYAENFTEATGVHAYTAVITPPTCTEQGYTTHTCTVCGDSYVGDYVDARGYDWMLEDGEFKILLIGNSFSEDASNAGMPNSQLLDILQAMLGEDFKVTVGLLYSGGKGLNWHATQSEQGNSSYSLRVISSESGKWKSYGSYTSANGLIWTNWDVVSLQHYEINTTTGKESNAYPEQVDPKFDQLKPATEFMLDYVAEYAPNAAVYFYMHWARAYKPNLNESLATYNKMAAFFPEVLDYAGTESANRFETIIPVGLSVQNARSTYLSSLSYHTEQGTTVNLVNDPQIGLQRDGGHLTYNVGRYIAALTFAEMVIPDQLRSEGYALPDIRVTESVGKLPDEYTKLAQMAVGAAVDSWKNHGSLAVTAIAGYEEDPTASEAARLAAVELDIPCAADADDLKSRILAAGKDFSVDALTLPDDFALTGTAQQTTATLTVRFGYTSVSVDMAVNVGTHAYESTVTAPTCTEKGYTTYTCSVCEDSYADDYVDALGHKEESIPAVAATCTATGLTEGKKCSVCGEILLAQTITEKLGHKEESIPAVAATCTTTGLTGGKKCSVCGEILVAQTVTEKLGHKEESIPAVSATCTATGLTEGKKCSVCGEILTAQRVTEKLGHKEVIDAAVAATCTASGLTEGKHCETCGSTLVSQTVVPALGHTPEAIPAVAPTCTEAGLGAGEKCGVCGITTKAQTTVPATGHLWSGGICGGCGKVCDHDYSAENGGCTVCGDKCAHRYDAVVTKPTCTAQGFTAYSCKICGNSYNGDYVEALGHDWADATCTAPKTCSACHVTEGEPNGHNHETAVTAPTCTEKGYTTHTCHCGDSYVDSYVDATGHTDGASVEENRVEANCTTAGSYETVVSCAVCGTELSRQKQSIPAKSHSYESVVTAPTCTQKGYTTHTCVLCGDSYADAPTDELGHYRQTADALGDGESLVLTTHNVVKHNKHLIFSATVENLGDGSICLSHGKDSYSGNHLEITAEKVVVYTTYKTVTVKEYTHGLTIDGAVHVRLDVARGSGKLTVTTESGTFSQTISWDGSNGAIACSVSGAALSNVDLRWYALGVESDYWIFGDSWFSTTSKARWTKYLLDDGYDVLLGAYGGMGAAAGLKQFKELLPIAIPQYAIWALGMNNGDRGGNINSGWLSTTQEFLALCEEYGVTPILFTIPHTPKVNNLYKNQWIRESGYRYIDFDLAVVENHTSGDWFEGMAASDLAHPTELGAKALYPQVFADFPELAAGKNTDCTHKLHVLDARQPDCVFRGRNAYYVCTLCGSAFKDAGATEKTDTAQMLLASLGHSYESVVTAPTCTEQGYTTYTCTVCGDSYTDSYVDATGHKKETIPAVAAACTATGLTEGEKCSVCGEILVAQAVTEKLGHKEETIPAVSATCTATGLTEGKKCSVCGEILIAQTVTEKFGHKEVTDAAVAATCTVAGLTEGKHCETCGTTLASQTVVPASGHTKVEIPAVAPTCTEAGLSAGEKCGICSITTKEQTAVPATGHLWSGGICGGCGKVCRHDYSAENGSCTICGDKCAHQYDAVVTKPTCTLQGYTSYTCGICGNAYNGDYVDASGHNWTDATCTAPKTCSVCGVTEGEPNGHRYDVIVTAPTCTEQGYTTHTCHCGDSCIDSYVDAKGHTNSAPIEENRTAPTCTAAGSYETVVDCAVCGAELSRQQQSIPATGHSYESVVTAPICTEQGYTTHTCHCGDTYADSYTPALGHSMGEWSVTDASCTVNGSKVRTCIRCDHSETEVIPATGHSHSYAVTAAPTEAAEGTLTGTCHCGNAVTKKLPKLSEADYTYSVVKEPTLEATGSAKYVWRTTEFGEFAFEVSLPKLPSPILLGDVNDDGKVSILDLMRLANYFAGKDVELNQANADVNGDGKISILDLMRLANYFAGKDVSLGKP